MNKIKYLLWDFDGTLAYRDGMWTDTLVSVLLKNNITHIKKEDIRPLLNIGFTWHSPDTPHKELFSGKKWWEYYENYFTEIYQKFNIPLAKCIKLSKEVRDEYLDIKQWHIYSDVENALNNTIVEGYQNVILSNHIPELSEIVIKLNIRKYFNKIYSSANIGYEKPNQKIFEYVLNDLHTTNINCIMIGDSYEADIAGAIRSGIKPIFVRKENSKDYKWFCNNLEDFQLMLQTIQNS